MPLKPKIITTAADRLYDLVKQHKEIAFKDVAAKLKVPVQTVEAWATFLEEDGTLSIKYKLTTPYLTMPSPKQAKKKKVTELQPMFQDKLAEVEIKSEMENVSELLNTAAENRSIGEFRALERISDDMLAKLQKITNFLISKIGLSPQRKSAIIKELGVLEKQVNDAEELLKNNKFDEANTAYSNLHTRMQQVLEDAKKNYAESKEESAVDEGSMQKLLERTYEALESGNLEDAENDYHKIRRMFSSFSNKYLSEKSEMQDKLVKLNRDIVVHAHRITDQRMQDGAKKIGELLKLTNRSINLKQFAQATSYYLQLKKLFESLPRGFVSEKSHLKEDILKAFEQIARDREKRLTSTFASMAKQIEELLKDSDKALEDGNVQSALETYKELSQIYSELPIGFMKEKFDLQNKLIATYNILSQKLESETESEMNLKSAKILQMLEIFKHQIDQRNYETAFKTYSEINAIFKQLPTGFIKWKTELQEKIIGEYEKLLDKKDARKTTAFRSSVEELNSLIQQAYHNIQTRNFLRANSLYKQIKAAYIKLPSADLRQRELMRNKILTLYRRILIIEPQDSVVLPPARPRVGDVHSRIAELKLRSKARVRMPA